MMMTRRAFTLVELMIVVAIIGILAAIAIPNFVEMQYRAKRAEVPANVDGIKTAEMGYDAAFDGFLVVTTFWPDSNFIGKKTQVWGTSTPSFQKLGWAPDGAVRGTYRVTTTVAGSTAKGADFVVTGRCDVDADKNEATYTATKSINTFFWNNNDTY